MNESQYKLSGVDIDAGASLVESIKPFCKQTHRKGCIGSIGGFGAIFDPKLAGFEDPLLISSTDGVGTKLKLAFDMDKHDSIGIDLVAMCVNDLVVQGAQPLFFLDYLATGKLNVEKSAQVIKGIAKGCKIARCALTGGETAEMPGMYNEGEYDLAGFTLGAVERNNLITGENIREGDIIIGIASSGVHSNGYSLVRKILRDNSISLHNKGIIENDDRKIGEILLEPTKIYVKPLLDLCSKNYMKAASHITGGGIIENIPRSVPAGFCANIDLNSWQMPKIFSWLMNTGKLNIEDMLRTFNCGIGMAVICSPEHKDECLKIISKSGEQGTVIGTILASVDKKIHFSRDFL